MAKRDEKVRAAAEINPGYASFQLAKALATEATHADAATRDRAGKKAGKWADVLRGIFGGWLTVGSRTPVQGAPAWATLEVVTGGFATGGLSAGGPVLPHETALLARVAPSLAGGGEAEIRRAINTYHLSEEGLAELRQRLGDGAYQVNLPEEGALLVVAGLVERGDIDAARELISVIAPHFASLRFYPAPATAGEASSEAEASRGTRVFLEDVATVVERLRAIQPHRGVLAQREAAGVWAPFYDRMVGLFLETVTGSPPTLAGDGGSDGMRSPVTGGWPCQVYPAGWRERAATLLAEMEAARRTHTLCGRVARAKHAYAQVREFLRRCVDAPGELTGREVGRIRLIVARSVAKRGMPDSAECRAARTAQARDVAAPMHHEVAKVVAGRLEGTGSRKAIENLSAMTRALDDAEAVRAGVMPGTSLPPSIVRRVERCWLATVEELVAREVIVSGEVLARVLPQMTSGVRAAGITDDRLRSVYAAVYRAFRRRRSLLLLNLESQVKVEELPWVAAIERFRQRGDGDLSPRDASRRALTEVAALTLTAFPQAIVPNKLLRELRELAKGAELDLPLVEEVAADIFMGQFSGQFVKAARAAADLMSGMLYARYYAIDYDTARRLPVLEKEELARSRNAGRWSDPFAEFCAARAGVTVGSVVDNGMTIEQQQIVTTQNLAVLVGGLGLRAGLGERFGDLARRCFVWVCRRLQVKADGRHAQLIALKNTAYAWRQMVFFLSMMTQEEVAAFVGVARGHLAEQRAAFGQRFEPAMRGLELAVAGETLDEETRARHGVRQFVGWVKGTHWLAG